MASLPGRGVALTTSREVDSEGGHSHEVVDVIGGCLCAVAGIALAQALYNAGVASRLMRAASRALAPISVASVRP